MKRKFTADEIREIWMNDDYVHKETEEHRRWSANVTLITEVEGKFYAVYFDQGLTESQDDFFIDVDAPEVYESERIEKVWLQK